MHFLINELPWVFLKFNCSYLYTKKGIILVKMERGFFFFCCIFNNDFLKAKKKKTLKINSEKQVKSKKKTQANQNRQAKQRNKKVMYLNL